MARPIESIEKEIHLLETTVSSLAQKLQTTNSNYLTSLIKGVPQQLIMAGYYICTQAYPEFFLQLSFSQTEQVQKYLKKVVKELQDRLHLLSENSIASEEIKEPLQLITRQKKLELEIANSLETASSEANTTLQQAGIFPGNVSATLIEATRQIDSGSEAIASAPNLVNIMVQNSELPEKVTPIMTSVQAIQLRLADIEFNNREIMSLRHQIRHLLSQLAKLQKEYQLKQSERLVVEAENAWRRSWFEE
jgi:DNA-binding transcriptional regulator GbsR (MarR family)